MAYFSSVILDEDSSSNSGALQDPFPNKILWSLMSVYVERTQLRPLGSAQYLPGAGPLTSQILAGSDRTGI
jgi:hypothetical protein